MKLDACVALIADDTNRSFFCNAKIYTADANIGSKKNIAQNFAGGIRERGNIFGVGDAELFMEEFSNIVAT